jgi:predicted metal-dependent hydrolase
MEINIIRSERRKKTVSARLVEGGMVVSAPASMSSERLEVIIAGFRARFRRRKIREELNMGSDLLARSRALHEKFFDGRLRLVSIEYAADQESTFGCCNHRTGRIRISHRVSAMPRWVRDYVIVHEMAHLLEPHHGSAFWKLVSRYPLAERARGYLIAAGMHEGEKL